MPELPQELIDLILERLDVADKKTLRNCSRVARSFRPTSQKHIFSHLTIRPSRGYYRNKSDSKMKQLRQIFACSPQLALNVRSIVLVGGGNSSWFQGDGLPQILCMLVNLTRFSIDSGQSLSWDSLYSDLVEAVHAVVSLPTLTRLRFHCVAFGQSTQLVSLLRSCGNLAELDLSIVAIEAVDLSDLQPKIPGLTSLDINPLRNQHVQCVTSALDLGSLQHLRISSDSPAADSEIQTIFDATETLRHFHVHLSHHHTDANMIDLRNLSHLQTLELTIMFEFASAPDEYDPILWARNILATLQSPSSVEHVVFNVVVDEIDLLHLPRLGTLEAPLMTPALAALKKLTINLESLEVDFDISGGDREVFGAFPTLSGKGMVEVGLLGVH
ncbi:hypothetical protein FB45DRAFT_928225 [Roridomyces roridus]|uniref:F-box domain-containing protein n=1 Tax=Roridomyces roridus TaxID=1738132 RepID=A0AAD7BHF2_9AGAR|nr:hypothetical protein FB45DRAFT_928225 [Roridomyces roridus]